MPYRRMTVTIPEAMRGTVVGIRVPTPIADELEQRLAPYVADLEARTANGRHPVAAGLALAVGIIRQAEVNVSGADPNVPNSQYQRDRAIVDWARRQLDRVDVSEALIEFGQRHRSE